MMESLARLSSLSVMVLVLFLCCETGNTQTCPFGWVDGPVGDACYLINTDSTRYKFPEAVTKCQSYQGQLIYVNASGEKDFVLRQLQDAASSSRNPRLGWWLGLHMTDNGIQWLDGTPQPSNEIPWGAGSRQGPCYVVKNQLVVSANCTEWFNLLCKRPKGIPLSCDVDNQWQYVNGSCFKTFTDKRTWDDAKNLCELEEGQLAKISTFTEQSELWDNVRSTKPPSGLWTGLHVVRQSGQLQLSWLDGTSLDTTETFWKDDNLAISLTPRTSLLIDGTVPRRRRSWDMVSNSELHGYACQRPEGVCEAGWLTHQTQCVKIYDSSVTWFRANFVCTAVGGQLLNLASPSDQKFIQRYLPQIKGMGYNSFWIGIWDNHNDSGPFTWTDGSVVENSTHWAQDPPPQNTMGSRDCGYINTDDADGRWQMTSDCDQHRAFVCSIAVGTPVKAIPTTARPANGLECERGWQTANSQCYYVADRRLDWQSASNFCEQILGSHLVVIRGDNDQGFINGLISGDDYWIGMSDLQATGSWKWVDGSSVSQYVNWARNEPNAQGNNEHCGAVWGTRGSSVLGRWDDRPCDTLQSFICQKAPSIDASSTIPPMTTPTPAVFSQKCGPHWEERPNSDWCYQFHDEAQRHAEALATCISFNGSLVSITDHAEQSYLAGRSLSMQNSVVWIGATDSNVEGGWSWVDGSPLAYINWNPGEPNNMNDAEDCGAMSTRTSRWNDFDCRLQMGFICKRLAPTHTTTPAPTTTPLPGGQYYSCPDGYIRYQGDCFITHTTLKTWVEARQACRADGGDLASLSHSQQNDFLFSMLPAETCSNVHAQDEECEKWAEEGECERNPVWMGQNCQEACRQCHRVCLDRYNNLQCQGWASLGECQNNPVWMMVSCARSCQACDADMNNLTGSWIGLSDLDEVKGSFTWSDASPVTFTLWHVGMPMVYPSKTCVVMTKANGGSWMNAPCEGLAKYVCKKPVSVTSVTPVPAFRVGCPAHAIGLDAFCYQTVSLAMTWSDAEHFCSSSGGHLATINSVSMQSMVMSQLDPMAGSHYWIGLTDTATPGTYTWTSSSQVLYTAWNHQHTGNERSKCVGMQTQLPIGLWQAVDCGLSKPFVCEFHRNGYTIPTTTTPIATTTPTPCPSGWSGFEDNCYKAFSDDNSLKSWQEARDFCRSYGGDLASVHNDSLHHFFTTTLLRGVNGADGNFWIGLTDVDSEATYAWSDGSPMQFSKWNTGEPNNAGGNEDCVEYNKYSNNWNDNSCYITTAFICSHPRGLRFITTMRPPTTTPAPTCDGTTWLAKDGYCYYVSALFGQDAKKTWFEARRFCQQSGADLASIQSEDVNTMLVHYTVHQQSTSRHYWIGFNKLGRTTYQWSDGSPVVYTAWEGSEPNDGYGGESCANMHSRTGRWRDDNCNYEFHFICKRDNVTTTPRPPVPTPLIKGGCPPGFSGVGNRCFHVGGLNTSTSASFSQARDTCRNMTSRQPVDIASISNYQEQTFVMTLLEGVTQGVFIGLNDRQTTRKYVWQDNQEVSVTYWAPDEPSETWGLNQEQCVMMRVDEKTFGLWDDTHCTYPRGYVCSTMKEERRGRVVLLLIGKGAKEADVLVQGCIDVNYPVITPGNGGCKDKYFQYRDSCYGVYRTPQTWSKAEETCVRDQGHLVSIRDIHELAKVNLFVYDAVVVSSVWIGLSFREATHDYGWVDGWPVTFTPWAEGEPSRQGDSACVAMSDSTWNDTSCGETHPYVCKISSVTPPSTTAQPPGYCADPSWAPHGAFCYFAEPMNKKSWPEANYLCKQKGMSLLSLHNTDELQFVQGLVDQAVTTPRYAWSGAGDKRVWLGLQRTVQGAFRWSDDSPYDYNDWNSGEPNNSNNEEECAELLVDSGKWNDIACISGNAAGERGFVCKSPKILPSTSTMTTMTTPSTSTAIPPVYQSSGRPSVATPPPSLSPGRSRHTGGDNSGITRGHVGHSTGSKHDNSLSGGQIAGIVIGLIALVLIVGAVVYVLRRRKQDMHMSGMVESATGFDNALYSKRNNAEEVALSSQGDTATTTTTTDTFSNGSNRITIPVNHADSADC